MEKDKVEHLMTIICQSSAVDKDNNSLSVFNIIEELSVSLPSTEKTSPGVTEKKNIPFPFEIVSVWRRLVEGDLSLEAKISLHDPEGEIIQEIPYKFEIKSIHKSMRMKLKSNGLVVTLPGDYYFSVMIKNRATFKEVAKVPLNIKIPVPTDLKILKK